MDYNFGKENNHIPWVTFCMTTYKRPGFLKIQLSAILMQSFTDFNVIISDNDPEGSGKTVVESFNEPRFSYHVNEVNLGMVKSFNRSLAKADGEYVVMITDDDPPYPKMLQTLYDLTIEYPGYGLYIGGCDTVCSNPVVATASRLKVGTNSCLANLSIGTVRKYNGQEFPFSFFKGEIGGHLLWSTGIVKREIALSVEGMPDFGSPYHTDLGYLVLCGARAGAVLINTSLGSQVVHGQNYGFTEMDFEKLFITPDAFYRWTIDRLPMENNYAGLGKHIETFLGRWVVEYTVSINKFRKYNNIEKKSLHKWTKEVFKIPYLRKWRIKYYLAVDYPIIFRLALAIKKRLEKNKEA